MTGEISGMLAQAAQSCDLARIFLYKPVIKQGQIFHLKLQRQMEEIGMDGMPATGGAAAAGPDGIAVAVDAIVVGNLFFCIDFTDSHDLADAVDCAHVNIGIAGVVDVALGRLHPDGPAVFEVVAVVLLAGWDGVLGVDGMGIVDGQNHIAGCKPGGGENTGSVDAGCADCNAIGHGGIIPEEPRSLAGCPEIKICEFRRKCLHMASSRE